MKKKTSCSIFGVVCGFVFMMDAFAASKSTANTNKTAKDSNAIVAKVGNDVIRNYDIDNAAALVPPELARGFTELQFRATVLKNLLRQKLLMKEAKSAHMEQDPEIRKEMQAASDRVVAHAYLTKVLKSRITEAALKQRYEQVVQKFKGEKEYKIALIVCENEVNAKEAVAALKTQDFMTVAKKFSVLPAQVKEKAAEGMFVLKMVLPKEVQDSLSKLKAGQNSEQIKTSDGFYVVKFFEMRDAKIPSIQESAQQLQMLLVQEQTENFLSELEKKSAVIYYDNEYAREIQAQDQKIAEAKQQQQ